MEGRLKMLTGRFLAMGPHHSQTGSPLHVSAPCAQGPMGPRSQAPSPLILSSSSTHMPTTHAHNKLTKSMIIRHQASSHMLCDARMLHALMLRCMGTRPVLHTRAGLLPDQRCPADNTRPSGRLSSDSRPLNVARLAQGVRHASASMPHASWRDWVALCATASATVAAPSGRRVGRGAVPGSACGGASAIGVMRRCCAPVPVVDVWGLGAVPAQADGGGAGPVTVGAWNAGATHGTASRGVGTTRRRGFPSSSVCRLALSSAPRETVLAAGAGAADAGT